MSLAEAVAQGQMEVVAAVTARFYGEALRWALALPLPELVRWHRLIPRVREADPMASAVWLRRAPER